MSSCAFVVTKEVVPRRNGNVLKLWEWLNSDKQFFSFAFNYINKYLHLENNFNHLKLRYTDPCSYLTKRALVSQPTTLVVAKDPNNSHY